jgi:hypothetical protein
LTLSRVLLSQAGGNKAGMIYFAMEACKGGLHRLL